MDSFFCQYQIKRRCIIMKTLTVNNQPLQIKEYDGQRVVTFKDIDTVHSRVKGTANRNFKSNKQHFIEGEDYYKVCADEIRRNKIMSISPKTHQDVVLITETGYLMLVKSFTDDLAWTVQRELVNSYFRQQQPVPNEPVYFDKFWNGEKVITIKDFEYFTGANQGMINYYVSSSLSKGTEYYLLEGAELQQFKYLNTKHHKQVSHLILLNYKGCIKLAELLKCNISNAECFKYVPYMENAMPEKKSNENQVVTVSRDPIAYKKLTELKEMTLVINALLKMIDTANMPIKRFPALVDTLQSMAVDMSCKAVDFCKMVDIKDWI